MKNIDYTQIARGFEEGKKSGTLSNGTTWSIKHDELDELDELHIFTQIADGFLKGNKPYWEVKIG